MKAILVTYHFKMRYTSALLMLLISWVSAAQDTLKTQYLPEIVVTSVKTEGDSLQNFYRANPSSNTEDLLSKMNGINLIRRGAYGQEPIIRGMSAGQINVTIDGMRMFSACTDRMDPISIYIEPQNLRSIDAALGTNGASLGGTVGGSLNLKLAEPQFGSGVSGKTGIGYQSVSRGFNYYMDTNYGQEKSAYRASFIYRKNQNYRDGNNQVVEYSQYEKTNLSVAARWKFEQHTLKASLLLDEGRDIGFAALPMDVSKAHASIYSLSYEMKFHGLLSALETKIYSNRIEHHMDDYLREVPMHMDMPGWSNTYGAYTEGQFIPVRNHSIRFRADYYHHKTQADMTMYNTDGSSMYMQTWPASHRNVVGLFVSDNIRIHDEINIDINGRLDVAGIAIDSGFGKDVMEVQNGDFDSHFTQLSRSINLNLKKLFRDHIIFNIHAGYGERLPTTSEFFGFYLFNRQDMHDYLGNPGLNPELAFNFDLGFDYYNKWLELKGNIFYQHMPDYILAYLDTSLDPMTPGAYGVKIYENIEYARFHGLELTGIINPIPKLQIVSNLKSTVATTFDGHYLPFIPATKNQTSIRYGLPHLYFQVEWEGALAQNNTSELFNERSTPGYSLFNLRTSYSFNRIHTKWDIGVGMENITDEYYQEHLDWGDVFRPGRNVYLTASLSF